MLAPQQITGAMVERGAKALQRAVSLGMQRAADFTEDQHYTDKRWNSSPRLMRERYTAEARACLEAALAGEPK